MFKEKNRPIRRLEAIGFSLVLLLFFNPDSTFAQEGGFSQMQDEVRSYIHEQVVPVIRVQRVKFDGILEDDEKVEITKFRKDLHDINKGLHEVEDELIHAHKSANPELFDQRQGKYNALIFDRRSLLKETVALAGDHLLALKSLQDEIRDYMIEWQHGVSKIHEAHDYDPKAEDNKYRRPLLAKYVSRVGFLLFDLESERPFAFLDDSYEFSDEILKIIAADKLHYTREVKFEIYEPGIVKIELLDAKGETIKEISSEEMQAGRHVVQIDLSEFPGEKYYCKITNPAGAEQKQLLEKNPEDKTGLHD